LSIYFLEYYVSNILIAVYSLSITTRFTKSEMEIKDLIVEELLSMTHAPEEKKKNLILIILQTPRSALVFVG